MNRRLASLALLTPLFLQASRFPKPDFEQTHHQIPTATHPSPDSLLWDWSDVGTLALALAVAAWLVHRRRSRTGVFWLSLLSLAWFGFYRQGCICPVGSLQNVALALFDKGYALPATALAAFLLPLLTALVGGRLFCAGACPLGAIQDAVVLARPWRVPPVLDRLLSLIPRVYLGVAVLLAATGATFLICRWDPFVNFFRLGGTTGILIFGMALLLLGLFVARPYCRYLCPYGVLLEWCSRLTWKRISSTPTQCVECKLCANACPFGAIREPTSPLPPKDRAPARTRLVLHLLLLPLWLGAFAAAGWFAGPSLAIHHSRVRLAADLQAVQQGDETRKTEETIAFQDSGETLETLLTEVVSRRRHFAWGGLFLGLFLGGVFGLRLLATTLHRTHAGYHPDQGRCLACARCFSYCPVDSSRQPTPLNTENHA